MNLVKCSIPASQVGQLVIGERGAQQYPLIGQCPKLRGRFIQAGPAGLPL